MVLVYTAQHLKVDSFMILKLIIRFIIFFIFLSILFLGFLFLIAKDFKEFKDVIRTEIIYNSYGEYKNLEASLTTNKHQYNIGEEIHFYHKIKVKSDVSHNIAINICDINNNLQVFAGVTQLYKEEYQKLFLPNYWVKSHSIGNDIKEFYFPCSEKLLENYGLLDFEENPSYTIQSTFYFIKEKNSYYLEKKEKRIKLSTKDFYFQYTISYHNNIYNSLIDMDIYAPIGYVYMCIKDNKLFIYPTRSMMQENMPKANW